MYSKTKTDVCNPSFLACLNELLNIMFAFYIYNISQLDSYGYFKFIYIYIIQENSQNHFCNKKKGIDFVSVITCTNCHCICSAVTKHQPFPFSYKK